MTISSDSLSAHDPESGGARLIPGIHSIKADSSVFSGRWDQLYLKVAFGAALIYFFTQATAYLMWIEWIPPISQSYIYGLMVTVVLTLRAVLFLSSIRTSSAATFGWVLLSVILAIQAFSFPAIHRSGGGEPYFQVVIFTAVISLLMWCGGETIGRHWPELRKGRRVQMFLWILFISLCTTVFLGVGISWVRFGAPLFYFVSYEGAVRNTFDYLRLTDALAISALLLMALDPRLRSRISVFVLASIALTFGFSRANLFNFLVCGVVLVWCSLKLRGRLVIVLFIAGFFLFAGSATFLLDRISDEAFYRRMSNFVIAPTEDESYIARLILLQEGISSLEEHWLFGNFMDEWWLDGELGGYVHNWLSFWICYGIVPFLMFVFLAIRSGHIGLRYWHTNKDEGPFVLITFTLIAILTAKPYTWPFIWLGIGIICSLRHFRVETGTHAHFDRLPVRGASVT